MGPGRASRGQFSASSLISEGCDFSGQIIFNNKVGGCDINVLTGVVPAYSSRGYITLLSEQNFLQSGVLVLLLLLVVSIKLPSCGT